MQYDLKDIAKRVARIRQLEKELYETVMRSDPGVHSIGVYLNRLTAIRLELATVADLLPEVGQEQGRSNG